MGRVTKVLEQPAAGGHVYCTNAGSGTRNLADRRQPFLEHSAYLCTLKAAADGIDHLHPRRVAVSTKSDPIRNVNLYREWRSGNFQGAHRSEEEAASEIRRSPGGELLHSFIACDVRLQTADSCHSRLWNPSGEDACVAHPA